VHGVEFCDQLQIIFACLPNVATLTRQRANKYNQLILNKKYLSIFQQFSKPVIQNYF
jgi:hypothetical protein